MCEEKLQHLSHKRQYIYMQYPHVLYSKLVYTPITTLTNNANGKGTQKIFSCFLCLQRRAAAVDQKRITMKKCTPLFLRCS